MSLYGSMPGARKPIFTLRDRLTLLEGEQFILVDSHGRYISRITLNRPERRNVMNYNLMAQLFNQLQINDQNPDVRVTNICGAGHSFCSGYHLITQALPMPMFEAEGDGQSQRNMLAGWFGLMDMAKPIMLKFKDLVFSDFSIVIKVKRREFILYWYDRLSIVTLT